MIRLLVLLDAACPASWGSSRPAPSLSAWDVVDSSYVEHASVAGQHTYTATRPFAVAATPAVLVV